VDEKEADTPNGTLEWYGKNSSGEDLPSVIYLYIVTNDKGKIKKGKLAIIR